MRALLLFLLLSLPLLAQPQEPDVTIDLQRGVGPVRFDMDDKQIHALGPIEEHSYFFHRKAWDSTWVWPADPLARIIAVLGDPPDERPAFIALRGYGSSYVLPNGLRLGSSLAEVEKLNGRPFALRGMAQEDSGEVLSWMGGELEQQLPGVRLFFHPLEDIADTLEGEEFAKVCGGMAMSDSPIWKGLHVEVGAIQIARPDRVEVTGPSFNAGETVAGETPAGAVADYLQNPESVWSRAFALAQSPYIVLLETLRSDQAYFDTTTMTLMKRTSDGGLERVSEQNLDFEWNPEGALSVMYREKGRPEAGLALSESGSLLTVVVWSPTRNVAESGIFSFILSDDVFPSYRLARNDKGVLEVRQVWKSGEPEDGPMDYFWDGESFRYANGARRK